jgi:hypothetical protein
MGVTVVAVTDVIVMVATVVDVTDVIVVDVIAVDVIVVGVTLVDVIADCIHSLIYSRICSFHIGTYRKISSVFNSLM